MSSIYFDVTAPTINLVTSISNAGYVLNKSLLASYSCNDAGSSGLASCNGTVANGAAIDTGSVWSKNFSVSATDHAGNPAAQSILYGVFYQPGGPCYGDAGHQILQPINASGTMSVFKSGSTVPTKFRVCDANGVSIGTPGVVTGYGLLSQGNSTNITVDEDAYSDISGCSVPVGFNQAAVDL